MKLIAESGGTKTQWCGISEATVSETINTIGLNPNFVTGDTIKQVLTTEVLSLIKDPEISEVWFYGAGCSGKLMEDKVRDSIKSVLPSTQVHVFSDLTGAARSLLGTR